MTTLKRIITICILCLLTFNVLANENQLLNSEDHQQLILVITDNWQVDHGLLYTFEKKAGQWQLISKANSVTVGKNGLAWGIGLHGKQPGQYKKEGDGKAPAGIFKLGEAFGYLKSVNTDLKYQQMDKNNYCIDVMKSPFYNQIVDESIVGEKAIIGSTEPMRRDIHVNGDIRYKKGIIVKHNPQNIIGQGSCIFMHVWKAKGVPTSGCTAMPEKIITQLLAWLEPSKKPLYILLPQSQYIEKRTLWGLPNIAK